MLAMDSPATHQQRGQLSVGARVSVHHSLSKIPERLWPRKSGVIIEDYSDLIDSTSQSYGRAWAITRRYAIALDDGCLIFRDENIEPER